MNKRWITLIALGGICFVTNHYIGAVAAIMGITIAMVLKSRNGIKDINAKTATNKIQ